MNIEIRNHILFLSGTQVAYKPSPNVGGVIVPKYLIIHYDAANNATSAINWMTSKVSGVSAHIHIARGGKITQLAPLNIKCCHAGKSEWKGIIGLNSHSIGIELQNNSTQEYTEIQLEATKEVSKALVSKYALLDILGHSDISPGRKVDPGPMFPMKLFKESVICETGKIPDAETIAVVNIRSGAGTNFKAISVLPKGTKVIKEDQNGDWTEVTVLGSGLKGFVSSKFLK